MTAEIAILNKAAVVLAADSAMTLSGIRSEHLPQRFQKVYPSDKLFPLSRSEPVGVMTYGNAEFMGVPWETLVKMYRRWLGDESRPTVQNYMDDLRDFIAGADVCTEGAQRDNVLAVVRDSFLQIYELVNEAADRSQSPGTLPEAAVEAYVSVLSEYEPHISCSEASKLISQIPPVDAVIDGIFGQEFKAGKAVRALLHRAARLALERDRLSRTLSGVVVAGFGEDELFPTLVAVETDGVIGSLRVKPVEETGIGRKDGEAAAAIIPFAQREMVATFMNGVDPEFLDWLASSIEELLFVFGDDVSDAIGEVGDRQRQVLRTEAKQRATDFLSRAARWMNEQHSRPIIEIVEHLPKQELADMAEALVSITSLKRRVSPDHEDVGGPIDVAAISKGDGFRWAKGKHVARSSPLDG